jgi:RNA polymerase sigma-70 factor (ECF subfamily)
MLERLRQTVDSRTWEPFVRLYTPLLYRWLTPYGLLRQDVDDILQEVFAVVARDLAKFHHNHRRGAFRRWLKTVLVNRLRAFRRSRRQAAASSLADYLEDPRGDPSRLLELEHDGFIIRRALERIEPEFKPATWQAFSRLLGDHADPEKISADLGMSVAAIYTAKSRVMKRLRQEIQYFLD